MSKIFAIWPLQKREVADLWCRSKGERNVGGKYKVMQDAKEKRLERTVERRDKGPYQLSPLRVRM